MAQQAINTANIYYSYSSSIATYSGSSGSNNSIVYVLNTGVTINKTSNVTSSNIGGIIQYTLIVSNPTTTTISNFVLQDTLPTGISFNAGSLTYNGFAFGSSDITLGVTLPTLAPSSIATLTFNTTVLNSAPNAVTNVAMGHYNTTVGTSIVSISIPSTPATVSILNNDISFVKTQSISTATLGSTGVYSFVISNNGNVPIQDLFILDTVPQGLTFTNGSLIVNGTPTIGSPNTGIYFSSLNPGGGILISYGFTVTSIPSSGLINNMGKINYSYTDPSTGNILSSSVYSNQTTLQVPVINVQALQTVNATDVTVGQVVQYTLVVQNLGNVDINSILAIGTIPFSSLAYVPNSLSINGVSVPDQNLIFGLSLPDISPNGTNTVNLSAQVISATPKIIPTIFDVLYNAGVSITGYSITPYATQQYSTFTNPWALYVLDPSLVATKTANPTVVSNGGQITYQIVLTNTGTDVLNNTMFYDTLPTGVVFNSATLNNSGITTTIGNPALGINLGSIGVGQTATINIITTGSI